MIILALFLATAHAFPDSTGLTYEERMNNRERHSECRLKLLFVEDIEVCVNYKKEKAYTRAMKKYPDLALLGVINYPLISFGFSEMHIASCVRGPEMTDQYYKTLEKDLRRVNECPKGWKKKWK